MRNIEKVFCVALILYYLFVFLLIGSDLWNSIKSPDDYSWIYHFNPQESFWKWPYFWSLLGYLILSLVGLFVAIQTLRINSKSWRISNLISTILMISFVGIRYFLWVQSGYDH